MNRGQHGAAKETAGAYGHFLGRSLALAYVAAGEGAVGRELEIEILGRRYPARVIEHSPHDPENTRLRA